MKCTLELDLELSERSRILLDSLSKHLPPRIVAAAPEADETVQAAPANRPHLKIGEHSEAVGGIYAGISRGLDGAPDGHLYLLDDKPAGNLNWAAACKWAEGLGNGARLPTRFESALLYANLQDKIETGHWYWTGSQYSDSYAWVQYFDGGGQSLSGKGYEGRCRAVRRLDL
jgi:hypothetical protein